MKKDREYLLTTHCQVNYACDSPWARETPYEAYQAQWLATSYGDKYLALLEKNALDHRQIVEIIEDETGNRIAFFRASFDEDKELGYTFYNIEEIYVEEPYRRRGIAAQLLLYAEEAAKKNRATVLRSGTGCVNSASRALHEKMGFSAYRVEYEKKIYKDATKEEGLRRAYGKLVRDNIPDIIRAQGETPIISILAQDTYLESLHGKLREEVEEYLEEGDLSEICDILEVLHAILKARDIPFESVEAMRKEKAMRNGAFDKRIFLKAVEPNS